MLKLKPASLDWALAHVESAGDTDIFPLPFEFKAIRHSWAAAKTFLADEDMTKWQTRPFRRCLSPKHRYGFRVSTQLDPLDALIFLSLLYEVGSDIEAARVPAAQSVAFAYRFAPTLAGGLFDPNWNYDRFQKHSQTLVASGRHTHVVVADIADFYPRIYSHPLENSLKVCVRSAVHVTALMRILSQWNYTISYGIPVGPAPSRLLAELAINDVDQAFLAEPRVFCRYSDDYRVFCGSEREAYEALAFLANTLFENHGLTLQQHKTEILTTEGFQKKYLTPAGGGTLGEQFAAILTKLGKGAYDPVEYASLDPAVKGEIDALGLDRILAEQVGRESIDIPVTRTALSILAQLRNHTSLDLVVDNLPKMYTVLKDAVEYIQSFKNDGARQARIGKKLLAMLEAEVVGHLEFHRCWVLSTFTNDRQWDNEDQFVRLQHLLPDGYAQRELILALGRANQSPWFKTLKRNVDGFSPWVKRAFLAAASCLPGDEYKHWSKSVEPRLDPLEAWVVMWARQNRFA